MKKSRIAMGTLSAAVAGILGSGFIFMNAGCVLAVREKTERPTLGMELVDLQKAKESGALTGPEYEKKRAALLKQ